MGKNVDDVVVPTPGTETPTDTTVEVPTTEAAFEQSEATEAGLTTLGDLDGV